MLGPEQESASEPEILSFREFAKILSPDWIVHKIKQTLKASAALY